MMASHLSTRRSIGKKKRGMKANDTVGPTTMKTYLEPAEVFKLENGATSLWPLKNRNPRRSRKIRKRRNRKPLLKRNLLKQSRRQVKGPLSRKKPLAR